MRPAVTSSRSCPAAAMTLPTARRSLQRTPAASRPCCSQSNHSSTVPRCRACLRAQWRRTRERRSTRSGPWTPSRNACNWLRHSTENVGIAALRHCPNPPFIICAKQRQSSNNALKLICDPPSPSSLTLQASFWRESIRQSATLPFEPWILDRSTSHQGIADANGNHLGSLDPQLKRA